MATWTRRPSHFIERMRWDEVARRIQDGAAAILPIGAAAKQHGFHLPLNTDRIQAEWLAGRLAGRVRCADLADPELRPLSGIRRICREAAACRLRHSRRSCTRSQREFSATDAGQLFVLNTGISTLAPVDRALARLDAGRTRHLWIHGGPRYRRAARRTGRAKPWQPCRRARNLADAGDRAGSGRHGARRSEPCRRHETTPGALTPSDAEFAELQPLRQLWRSDTGDLGQGRSLARRHARRSQRTGRRRSSRKDLTDKPRPDAMPRRAAMKSTMRFAGPSPPWSSPPCWQAPSLPRRRAIGIYARRPHALRCVRPIAQDRSRGPRRHHPCRVRARRLRAAQRKAVGLGQDVSQGRHGLLRPLSRQLAAAAAGARSMAPAFAAAPHGVIAAPPFASRSAATPPRMCCGATG